MRTVVAKTRTVTETVGQQSERVERTRLSGEGLSQMASRLLEESQNLTQIVSFFKIQPPKEALCRS